MQGFWVELIDLYTSPSILCSDSVPQGGARWSVITWPQKKWKKWKGSRSAMSDSATPWTVAYEVPPSMEFSRQEYWSGLPFPSSGDLPDPGVESGSPALQADDFTIWATREAPWCDPRWHYKMVLQNQNTSCSFIADRYLVFHLHLFVTSLSLLYFEELAANKFLFYFWYLQFSRSVMSDSLRPHELQHARPPCPSQTAHRDGDAIQSSHPQSSPSPPAPHPSQHQGLFQWVNSLHEVAIV